jgi:predicted amidohydrolase
VQVLLAQLTPVPGAVHTNVARLQDVLARRPDADVAVFPELFLSGYDLPRARERAIEPHGPELEAIRRTAGETSTAVVVGFAERDGDALYNSVALIDETGAAVGVYRKVALFGAERDVFSAGDRLVVAHLAGRRVGALICFDVEFPELARDLGLAGADLLITASANMAPYHADHELASRARALDNRLPHVYVNRVGREGGLDFVGGSRLIAADGAVLQQCTQAGEQVEVVSVETGAADDLVQYLAQVPARLPVAVLDSVSGGTT